VRKTFGPKREEYPAGGPTAEQRWGMELLLQCVEGG